MANAIDTLEGFDFASSGTPTTNSHTRSHSVQSGVSSLGYTHELHRAGSVLVAHPRAVHALPSSPGSRLARASLVPSQLFRSVSSFDMLNAVSESEDPRNSVPSLPQLPPPNLNARAKYRSHYGANTLSPTLSSLVDTQPVQTNPWQESTGDLGDAADTAVPLKRNPSFASSVQSSSLYHWRKSRRTRTAKSSASRQSTRYTVDSHAPSAPSLYHNPFYMAEIAQKEAAMPLRNLLKRAGTLSRVLDDMDRDQNQVRSGKRHSQMLSSQDSIDLQGYLRDPDRQMSPRKHKKAGLSLPAVWSSSASSRALTTGIQQRLDSTEIVPVIEPLRRRQSYPNAEVKNMMEPQDASHSGDRSSFSTIAASQTSRNRWWPKSRRKWLFLSALSALLLALIVGLAVGLGTHHSSATLASPCPRTCLNGGNAKLKDGTCVCSCSGPYVGAFCQLGELFKHSTTKRYFLTIIRRRNLCLRRWLRKLQKQNGSCPAVHCGCRLDPI